MNKKGTKIHFADYPSAIIIQLFVFLYFSIFASGFMSVYNLNNILIQSVIPGIMVLGVAIIIISGGLDLSVGNVLTLSGCICGVCLKQGLPIAVAAIVGILTGSLCGVVNGLMISKLKLPPFIATLAMANIAVGLANTISQRKPVYWETNAVMDFIGTGNVMGISIFIIVGVIVILAVLFIFYKTRLRTNTYVLGGNEEVLHLAGISITRWKVIIYGIAGTLSGICGILMNARVSCADPTVGTGLEFTAVVGAVIGGNIQNTGKGNLFGALLGAVCLATIRNGLSIMKLNTYWQMVITGVILVAGMLIREISVRWEQKKRLTQTGGNI